MLLWASYDLNLKQKRRYRGKTKVLSVGAGALMTFLTSILSRYGHLRLFDVYKLEELDGWV